MLANDVAAVEVALRRLSRQWQRPPAGQPLYDCPTCGMGALSEDMLHMHTPMYHAMERVKDRTKPAKCPICGCCDAPVQLL